MRKLLFIGGAFIFAFFRLSAQSEELARNFFDQGQYEKALKVYQQLAGEDPANPDYFYGMVSAYQQLEEFQTADDLLREKLEHSANNPGLLIELGHNYELKKETAKAREFYQEALSAVEARPNYAYTIARSFEKYNLLEMAAAAYERGMALNPDQNFSLQLARIYGEQGKMEEMFDNYIDLIETNPAFFNIANREFGRYISEDGKAPANQVFRKLLLKKLQNNPLVLYNEMLSWLFIQQKEFGMAFTQQKALYRRGESGLQELLRLAAMARNAGDTGAAKQIITYVIKASPSENMVLQGKRFLLQMASQEAKPDQLNQLEMEYSELLEDYGKDVKTLDLQLDFARFLAFRSGKKEAALGLLKELSEKIRSDYDKARLKMDLADILVLQEKFNEALIYYSQVQNLVKNDVLAQDARFNVARTSYFKGDFKWAKKQLDVLKASTSQLIANDAMELSLLIQDNSLEDTTLAALKKYAHADLLAFQGRNPEALTLLGELIKAHQGEKIVDEALLMQARLFERQEQFREAEANYLEIIRSHKEDILADNAHFYLAELYAGPLDEQEKAKEYYEQIIFNFADSIYFTDARRKYRLLRGDNLE